MNFPSFETMPIEELWALHGEIAKLLQTKIIAEKQELERRLTNLQRVKHRTSYPEVFPKYRNPDVPTETWSGRGKQPR